MAESGNQNPTTDGGGYSGGSVLLSGGSRRRRGSRKYGKRGRRGRRYNGGCSPGSGGVANNALAWDTIAPLSRLEGMGVMTTDGLGSTGSMTGGHRCSMRHKRGKRTRKHAGRKSRKNKSRRYGLSLNRILGRS